MGIGMDEHLKTVLAILDYIVSYWMLKLARTLLLSTLILLVILFVRKMWDVRRRRDDPLSGLYVKAYLWLVLLPVPFMGGLKLSFEHFPSFPDTECPSAGKNALFPCGPERNDPAFLLQGTSAAPYRQQAQRPRAGNAALCKL